MASISSMPMTPGGNAADLLKDMTATAAKTKASTGGTYSDAAKAKAKAASQDFEAVFLNSMFQSMFTGLQGEGPMGGNGATGTWRSFLTDEYAKSFAKAGGIGIAPAVYNSLLAQQEVRQ